MSLSTEKLIELYQTMLSIRRFEEEFFFMIVASLLVHLLF